MIVEAKNWILKRSKLNENIFLFLSLIVSLILIYVVIFICGALSGFLSNIMFFSKLVFKIPEGILTYSPAFMFLISAISFFAFNNIFEKYYYLYLASPFLSSFLIILSVLFDILVLIARMFFDILISFFKIGI
jgi:hypothetical protein